MQFIEKNWKGMLLCLIISTPCWFLGKSFPLIGGPVFAIIAGMIVTLFIHDKTNLYNFLYLKRISNFESDDNSGYLKINAEVDSPACNPYPLSSALLRHPL